MHHLRLKTEWDAHTLCNFHNRKNVTLFMVTPFLKTTDSKKNIPAANNQLGLLGSPTAFVPHQHLNR